MEWAQGRWAGPGELRSPSRWVPAALVLLGLLVVLAIVLVRAARAQLSVDKIGCPNSARRR